MLKRFSRVTHPALLLLLFAHGALAQEDERPEFKMPCRQVLKLSPDRFADVYGKRTEDYSTAGQKMAFGYYVNCKRPANDALAAKLLTEERQKRARETREVINKLGTAFWDLTYGEAGGGTMWGLVSAGAYAERERFMETVIRTLALPGRRLPRARSRAEASLAAIRRLLKSPERKPFTEGSEPEDAKQFIKAYEESLKEARDSFDRLESLVKGLPDAAAERVAVKAAGEARNALQNDN